MAHDGTWWHMMAHDGTWWQALKCSDRIISNQFFCFNKVFWLIVVGVIYPVTRSSIVRSSLSFYVGMSVVGRSARCHRGVVRHVSVMFDVLRRTYLTICLLFQWRGAPTLPPSLTCISRTRWTGWLHFATRRASPTYSSATRKDGEGSWGTARSQVLLLLFMLLPQLPLLLLLLLLLPPLLLLLPLLLSSVAAAGAAAPCCPCWWSLMIYCWL